VTPPLLGKDAMKGFEMIYSEAEEYIALEDVG
jgi:hypothetical protein